MHMRIATSENISGVKTRRGRSAQRQKMSECSLLHSAQINTGNTTNASTRKCGKITRHLKTRLNFIQVTKPNPSTHTLLSHFYAPASAQFTKSQSIVEDVICKLYWRDNEEADGAADDVVSFRNENEASSAVNFREARRGALVTLLPNS